MRRIAFYALTFLLALTVVGAIAPLAAIAQEGTPVASPGPEKSAPPAVGSPIDDIGSACNRAEFPAGMRGITYEPLEDFGFVVPVDAPDHNLYLTVSTLPPGTCINFRGGTFGPATFFVLDGEMQVIVWSRTRNLIPVVKAGNAAGDAVTVPDGAPVTLEQGDWLTVDREASYAYRNPGYEDARIVMAVYEIVAHQANGCVSGCRRHP